MATIEQLAKSPEAIIVAIDQINDGLENRDPLEAYKGAARYATISIAGPDFMPNIPAQEKKESFLRSLSRDVLREFKKAKSLGK